MTSHRGLTVGIVLTSLLTVTACSKHASNGAAPTPSSSGSTSAVPRPSDYVSAPASLPATPITLSTSKPPWPAPATLQAGDPQGMYPTAAGLPFAEEMLQVHYHAHLDVIVDGKHVAVPGGVGFVGTPPDHYTALAPLHTHDASGIIHIENDRPATFVLGQFFIEWGVRLDQHCIGGLCAGSGKQLAFYVDGKAYTGDPTRIVLTKHEEIAVEYGDTGSLPAPPSSYSFPSGE